MLMEMGEFKEFTCLSTFTVGTTVKQQTQMRCFEDVALLISAYNSQALAPKRRYLI